MGSGFLLFWNLEKRRTQVSQLGILVLGPNNGSFETGFFKVGIFYKFHSKKEKDCLFGGSWKRER